MRQPKRSADFAKQRKSATSATDLVIHTKVPSKWRLVDLETGQVYKYLPFKGKDGRDLQFTQVDPAEFLLEFAEAP